MKLTVEFEVDSKSYPVAYTILSMMLKRGWDEPWFRDSRVKYIGIAENETSAKSP